MTDTKPKVAPEIIVGLEGRPLCELCKLPIEAAYKTLSGKDYHPKCFDAVKSVEYLYPSPTLEPTLGPVEFKKYEGVTRETLDTVLDATSKAAMRASMPGRKDDSDKARWDLLPFGPLSDVVAVLTYGAKKYAPNNWQRVENPRSRYLAAALRHIVAWQEGERVDSESGHPHLAHATCCLLFAAWFDRG